jgi:hypothetical protein
MGLSGRNCPGCRRRVSGPFEKTITGRIISCQKICNSTGGSTSYRQPRSAVQLSRQPQAPQRWRILLLSWFEFPSYPDSPRAHAIRTADDPVGRQRRPGRGCGKVGGVGASSAGDPLHARGRRQGRYASLRDQLRRPTHAQRSLRGFQPRTTTTCRHCQLDARYSARSPLLSTSRRRPTPRSSRRRAGPRNRCVYRLAMCVARRSWKMSPSASRTARLAGLTSAPVAGRPLPRNPGSCLEAGLRRRKHIGSNFHARVSVGPNI